MSTLKSEIERISKEYKQDDCVLVVVWTKQDIQARAKKLKLELTSAEIDDVMLMLQQDFDPIVGVNQKVIDEALSDFSDDEDDEEEEVEMEVDPEEVAEFYPKDDEE